MKKLIHCVFAAFLLLSTSGVMADSPESFLDPDQAFRPHVSVDEQTVAIRWTIEKGYFLYRHGFNVELGPGSALETLPFTVAPGQKKYDAFFERNVEIYHDSVQMSFLLPKHKIRKVNLTLTAQGCADDGLCFPPTSYKFTESESGNFVVEESSLDQLSNNLESALSLPPENGDSWNGSTMLWVFLGALAGGFILNLMPCVFPVLSLKALSLTNASQSKAELRTHSWLYTGGVVVSFLTAGALIIIARSSGESLGWGFQLQQPAFVTFMVYLFFIMGLSLSGVFEFGRTFSGVGQTLTQGNKLSASFFTGVLAALVASPCTAPFMATAMGVALTQPAWVSLLIFAVLGFGMAAPFLALSYFPKLSLLLPQPGNWMVVFKQALSFPMFFTVIWLLWVLSHQTDSETLILTLLGLVFIVASLWLIGLSPKSRKSHVLRNVLAGVLILPALQIAANTASVSRQPSIVQPEAFTLERLAQYRTQGQPVFIDLTADWCITCKVNEKVAFTQKVRDRLKAHGITVMIGDWTNQNPDISALLAQYQRSGVPLYLMYPYGDGNPQILPQLLTENIMETAIERAVPSQTLDRE